MRRNILTPIVAAPQIEIIPLFAENAAQKEILELILEAFHFSDKEFGYEVKLREALSKIWFMLFDLSLPMLNKSEKRNDTCRIYKKLSSASSLSDVGKREEPVTVISHACGLGSSSYLRKIFREYAHCTPSEYRRKWQNCGITAEAEYFLFAVYTIMISVKITLIYTRRLHK